MIKISLSSPSMRMGKTTISDYLVEKHNFKRLILAKTLKKMGIILLQDIGLTEERIKYYTEIAKEEIITELGVSWRWICQSMGTEFGRNLINKDIWLKTTNIQMKENGNFVCDDTRFLNEYEFFKQNNFTMIQVIKPDVKIIRNHSSEGALDNVHYDYVIINDGTLEDLYKSIDKIIEILKYSEAQKLAEDGGKILYDFYNSTRRDILNSEK